MKKLLFSLGTVAAITAPVAAVVACGSKDKAAEAKINGKSAAEIKAMSAADFTTFLNDTFKKEQPEVDTTINKFKVTGTGSSATIKYFDTKGTEADLIQDLTPLGVYVDMGTGEKNLGNANKHDSSKPEVKAWWKDVVAAWNAYIA